MFMNNENKNILINSPFYAFRAESDVDADLVHALLEPWLECWVILERHYGDSSYSPKLAGTTVGLKLADNAPKHMELLSLIDALPHCQVVVETFEPFAVYSGERERRHVSGDLSAVILEIGVIKEARKSLALYGAHRNGDVKRATAARSELKKRITLSALFQRSFEVAA